MTALRPAKEPKEGHNIGADPGSGLLVLCMDDVNAGTHYYDHAYTHPDSADESNAYPITDSFATLLTTLELDHPLPPPRLASPLKLASQQANAATSPPSFDLTREVDYLHGFRGRWQSRNWACR